MSAGPEGCHTKLVLSAELCSPVSGQAAEIALHAEIRLTVGKKRGISKLPLPHIQLVNRPNKKVLGFSA